MAAAKLDVMSKINDGNDVTAESLATSSGWDVSATNRLLDSLVALQLLQKSTNAANKGDVHVVKLYGMQ